MTSPKIPSGKPSSHGAEANMSLAPGEDDLADSPLLLGKWDAFLEVADRVFGVRVFDVGHLLTLTSMPPAMLAPAIRQLVKRGLLDSHGYMVQITMEGHNLAQEVRRHSLRLKEALDEVYSAMHGGTSCFIIGRRHADRVGVIRLAAAEFNPRSPPPLHDASELSLHLDRVRKPTVLAFANVAEIDMFQAGQMRNCRTAFILEGGPRFRSIPQSWAKWGASNGPGTIFSPLSPFSLAWAFQF